MFQKIYDFFTRDLWELQAEDARRPLSWLISILRITTLAVQNFRADYCIIHASALTYYSLLAIVPVLAMAFGVAKGFGFDDMLEHELMTRMQSQEEVITRGIEYAHNLLQNTRGGLIAGIGVILLFWTIIRMIGTIEGVFNHIWGISEGRSIGRKCSDYLSISLIAPFFLIISNGLTVIVTSKLKVISNALPFINESSFPVSFLLDLLPYLAICALLTFLYSFLPNTKVRFKTAFMAGIVTGALYHMFQWLYLYFQIGIASYGAIYGSFAALPLFLIWLQLSWVIILLGAEIAFAYQNVEKYTGELAFEDYSHSRKKLYALQLMKILVKSCADQKPPMLLSELLNQINMPARSLQKVLNELIEKHIILETNIEGERAYHVAWDINKLSIFTLFYTMEHDDSALPEDKEQCNLIKRIDDMEKSMEGSKSNQLIKEM
ncbi:Uncharacterized protein SCG7109_AN_00060 [Chlamydiales bacterium SCGC AG-110-M15]|nr:Uncharacterized protein SCG7109_AN_00060 [Chlamydiales bacterium SCGC AG-110-M15]